MAQYLKWGLLIALIGLFPAEVAFAEETDKAPEKIFDFSPFKLEAGGSVSEGYTDNVFSTENHKKSDFVTILSPSIELSAKTDKTKLTFGANADVAYFNNYTSENYTDGRLRGEGEVKLAPKVTLFGGADYAWQHEDRSSIDDFNGSEPTKYREGSGFAGISARVDDLTFRVGGNVRSYNYDDTPTAAGPSINNDDRDRLQTELGGRVGHVIKPGQEVFVQGIYDQRDYDSTQDDLGYKRSSKGYQLAVGAAGRIDQVSGEVLVGVMSQNYDDPSFDTVTTYDFGLNMNWHPDPKTRVTALVERRIDETTLSGASGYIATTAGVRVRRSVGADLSANAFLFLTQDNYQNVSQTDYVTEAGMGLRYFITPNVYIGGDYSFEQRSSTVAAYDYDTHMILLSLGTDLQPHYKDNASMAQAGDSGFYVGIQGAHGGMATSVDGPRGGSGSLTASFGGWGFAGGLLGGYRVQMGNLELGLELDSDLADTSWTHDGDRDYSVDKKNSVGLSAIVGFRTQNDVLLYGRAGAVGTEFETKYMNGGNSTQMNEREVGMRFGGGAEFPISGALSGRMEYTVTSYPDYNVGAPTGTANDDNFSTTENLARIALIYKFGQKKPVAIMPVDFSGFYAGAAVGYGLFGSDNTGPRPNAAAPTFQLSATRGDQGVSGGLYGGYGYVFNNIYVGGEIEGDLSGANWNIAREPTGRIYSVDKVATVGAGMRLGYILNNAVLIYGRAGVVNGWFDTDYTVGANSVSRTDSETGLRFGGGIEFSLTKSLHMRLDYTQTDYSSYSVNYGSGVDKFDNSENLFRVGLSKQF